MPGEVTQALSALPTDHAHRCKDREDDICSARHYCECECGARVPYKVDGSTDYQVPMQSEWSMPEAGK